MRSTEVVASPAADLAGEEEGGVAVVIVVTVSPLLTMEAAALEVALDSKSNSRCVSSNMIILNVRYATSTIQEVHGFAGGAMKRTTKKKRRRMLSPMAWTPTGMPTLQQQTTSKVNLTS